MNEIDYKRFFQIMSALMAGRRVSKEDRNYFADAYEEGDPAVYARLSKQLDSGTPLTDEDKELYFSEARKMALKPENKAAILDLAQQAEQGRIAQNVKTGLNLLLAGTDIATSVKQIREADQLQKNARRPSRPAPLERDILLQNALSNAANTGRDVERALLPAREANREQFQNDLRTAQTASAGQASSYGTYGQGAALRRERADMNLVPLGDQVRRQGEQRYDRLLQNRLAEGQAINASQGRYYGEDLYQYGIDRQMAGELGQVGRSNLRSSYRGLAAPLPGAISRYASNAKYDDIYNRMLSYGEDNAKIASEAFRTNDNNWQGPPSQWEIYRRYEDSN